MSRAVKRQIIAPEVIPTTITDHKEWRTLAEKVAQSGYYFRNYPVPALRENFPADAPRTWNVDQYFPHAKCGGLYVDIVQPNIRPELLATLLEAHKERLKVMRAAGLRYVYVSEKTTMAEALGMLGEL